MPDNIEQRLVFAYSPNGTGDGVPLVVIGLPAGAWEHMRDGNTTHVDMSKFGVNLKLVLFGGESHDAVMKVLEQATFARGDAILDERQKDFGIAELEKDRK